MSFITDPTGSIYAAKSSGSAEPTGYFYDSDANNVRSGMFNLAHQFRSGTELPLTASSLSSSAIRAVSLSASSHVSATYVSATNVNVVTVSASDYLSASIVSASTYYGLPAGGVPDPLDINELSASRIAIKNGTTPTLSSTIRMTSGNTLDIKVPGSMSIRPSGAYSSWVSVTSTQGQSLIGGGWIQGIASDGDTAPGYNFSGPPTGTNPAVALLEIYDTGTIPSSIKQSYHAVQSAGEGTWTDFDLWIGADQVGTKINQVTLYAASSPILLHGSEVNFSGTEAHNGAATFANVANFYDDVNLYLGNAGAELNSNITSTFNAPVYTYSDVQFGNAGTVSMNGPVTAAAGFNMQGAFTASGKLSASNTATFGGPVGFSGTTAGLPYDIAVYRSGSPDSSEVLLRYNFIRGVSWSLNMSGSRATGSAASTGTPAIAIAKNGTAFGSCTFSASASGTFTGSAQTFVAGDVLTVTTPAAIDSTLAGISITFAGTRT